MLKNLSKFLLTFFFISSGHAKSPLTWNGNLYKHIHDYKKIHSDFFKTTCSPGTEFKYYKLLKSYRGNGYYLPQLENEEVDRDAIRTHLDEFQKKISFINGLIKNLKKQKDIPKFDEISKDVKETTEELLNYKKELHNAVTSSEKEKIYKKSNDAILKLKKEFDVFVSKISFLKSYRFPVDHLENRAIYDKHKDNDALKKANAQYFLRKIVEDGAYDKDQTRPDLFIRSTLDTIYLAIQKEKNFFSENTRYDLDWLLDRVDYSLSRGKKKQLERLNEWLERTKSAYKFYQDISNTKNRKVAKKMIHERNVAAIELKNFVTVKQAEVYKYWLDKPDLMKALFSTETILFNEVGRVDGEDGLERRDVAQVVLNRVNDDFYSSLSKKQELYDALKMTDEKIQSEKWLNVLFRVGEFSFTYYYISGVLKIFCPDMTKIGKNLRDSNLKISLQALNGFEDDFKAVRYFSRASMLGRIDMASVWSDYQKLPEKPGLEIIKQNKLVSQYKADQYEYLYDFKDNKGFEYLVLKIDETTYSMRFERGQPKFFKYRNPHYFTYFSQK